MKTKLADVIAELVAGLRRAGVAVSVAEAMDAARAATMVGVERRALRDGLAATLIKDEADRPVFLAAFAAVFPAAPADVVSGRDRQRGRRGSAGGAGTPGRASGDEGSSAGSALRRGEASAESSVPVASSRQRADADRPQREGDHRRAEADGESARANGPRIEGDDEGAPRRARSGHDLDRDADAARADEEGGRVRSSRLEGERRLRQLPFRAMTPADVEACAALVRTLATRVTARVRRRLAPRPTGRLDFRRTIRAAVPRGGIPFERRYRYRRPGAPDLVALADLSASTATATAFFLTLLAPAAAYFRRVHLFGYVDHLVEIEFVSGQVRPAAPLDLMARSDFGRVLRDLVAGESTILGADTVLLVLGDARNNRRPPRADLLAAARARVRRALWLNPEPPERWNTGDSVIASYARHVDAVVACGTLAELDRALAAVTRL